MALPWSRSGCGTLQTSRCLGKKRTMFFVWAVRERALPKFQNRRQQSPLLLECLDDQWYGHFADLEAGLMTNPGELLQRCVHRQSTRTTVPCTSLTALPTLDEVERVLRNVQPHKAPGPDQLPGALFRYGANILAPMVHDAFLKTYTWECEAIQSKRNWWFQYIRREISPRPAVIAA